MPLVVLCGQPSSGKSTVAGQLAEAFKNKGYEVQIVDEPSFHLIRNEAYQGGWQYHGHVGNTTLHGGACTDKNHPSPACTTFLCASTMLYKLSNCSTKALSPYPLRHRNVTLHIGNTMHGCAVRLPPMAAPCPPIPLHYTLMHTHSTHTHTFSPPTTPQSP